MPVLPEVGSTRTPRPGRNPALRLERVDHGDADAILDAADRVEEFELREEARGDPLFPSDAVHRNERRVPDRVGDRGVNPCLGLALARRSLSSSSHGSP